MQQKVHNVSYLAKATLSLKNLKPESFGAIAIPAKAEIVNVNVEVLEAGDVGTTLNIGLIGDDGYFAQDLDLSRKAHYTSANQTQIQETGTIDVKINQESTSGQIVVRVLYFLPSTILTEY